MKGKFGLGDKVESQLIAANRQKGILTLRGDWLFELIRSGKIIDKWEMHNLIVNEGLSDILTVYLNSGTQDTTWFMILKDEGAVPVAGDTLASHGAWVEATGYSSGTRPAIVWDAESGQSIDNTGAPTSFTFTGTDTIAGAGIVADNTKGGTSGILFSLEDFVSDRVVVNNDVLNVTVTIASATA